MADQQFFFVLGMPRCRTAWLSVLLSPPGSWCVHEGMSGHPDFDSYAASLRARPEPFVGDSSPALFCHADRLKREFPAARFAIITRDPAESLGAFLAAGADPLVADGWPEYLRAVEAASRILDGPRMDARQLDSFESCANLYSYLLDGAELDPSRFQGLSRLRITSTFPPVEAIPPVEIPPPPQPPQPWAGNPESHGFSTNGLTAGLFDPARHSFVRGWFESHKGYPMPEVGLPPLGVIVYLNGSPAGALWCFETFGTGVAWIEFPITCPGLSMAEASRVMAFAVMALTEMAGKAYDPPAFFNRFRASCPPAMSRVLRRLGFVATAPRDNLILTL